MLQRSRALFVFQQARLGKHELASGLYILKCGSSDGTSSDAHDILARNNIFPSQPNSFAHQSSHSIALDGVADAFAGGETKAAIGKIVGKDDQDD